MNTLRTAIAELWGLFVDDGPLAVFIVAWVGVFAGFRSHLPAWALFVGLAVLVVVFARRRAIHLSRSKEKTI